ncbi:hypothetical protein [Marinomonas algicola]|uniref:hypothetical protein n=1 Tax=Marinomonas algicola TaxID=2773454 RepID=UPI00174E0A5D|nr:hypothetical protein [Marinomonas algicola]
MNVLKNGRLFLLLISVFYMAACSNKDLYEAIQDNRVNECRNMTYNQEQACLNSINQKSYEEYNRERGVGVETDTTMTANDDLSFSHTSRYNN